MLVTMRNMFCHMFVTKLASLAHMLLFVDICDSMIVCMQPFTLYWKILMQSIFLLIVPKHFLPFKSKRLIISSLPFGFSFLKVGLMCTSATHSFNIKDYKSWFFHGGDLPFSLYAFSDR